MLSKIDFRENAHLFESLANEAKVMFFKHDPFKNAIQFSDFFYERVGYEKGSINTLEKYYEILASDEKNVLNDNFQKYITCDGIFWKTEEVICKSDGSLMHTTTIAEKVWSSDKESFVIFGITQDITAQKEAEKELHVMAYYDTITGLPNRAYFNASLQKYVDQKMNGFLMFLDLDNFKNINDVYGHSSGDAVLKEIADRLTSALPTDSFVSRLGGDELAAIIHVDTIDEIKVVMDKMFKELRTPYKLGANLVYTTFSAGLVSLSLEETDSESLLGFADMAMYEAKRNGKNQYRFFDNNILLKIHREVEIEDVLRTAIETGELYCIYQPIFEATTNEIYSFETLLRLNSKKLGNISPKEFIPVAEKTGQIINIVNFAIHTAAKKAVEWRNQGYKFEKINLNLSHVSIQKESLKDTIISLIEDTGISYDKLNIQFAESDIVEFQDDIARRMEALCKMGINFALDRFGTGVSSLRYLSAAFFSSIKIDISYISKITQSEKIAKLVKNMIQTAHILDMKVVAVGVETLEQYELLKSMNCDYVQGLYFAGALEANEIEELLKSRSC